MDTQFKVLKLHILKPAGNMSWKELSDMLFQVRYRVFRLANMIITQRFLELQKSRNEPGKKIKGKTAGEINKELWSFLKNEKNKANTKEIGHIRFAKEGALPAPVVYCLAYYKIRGLITAKWKEIASGKASLPSFRKDMAIPVRCDQPKYKRLERVGDQVEVELMICLKPYPRVVIATARNSLSDGQRAILNRLLDGKDEYRQRYFEIKYDERSKKWHLFVTYECPVKEAPQLSKDKIVGVDLGFYCPLYAAVSDGYERLGGKELVALGARIRALKYRVMKQRREIQRGGKTLISQETSRSGHGRARKLKPIQTLEGKIKNAYTTLNHQLSRAVVDFAKKNGAGIIQIEDLTNLKDEIAETFIGRQWRYHQLQEFIEYKAQEIGIEVRKINPRYTSRRCSNCGHINMKFDSEYRKKHKEKGQRARFICLKCDYQADPDYNAARNLTVLGIDAIISEQMKKQGID